jgi:hypothetical protein
MTSLTHVIGTDRWKAPVVSAFICVAASMSLAGAKVAIRDGFGAGDLLAFFVWTVPLSLVVALIHEGLAGFLRARTRVLTYTLSGMAGIFTGVSWTYLVALWLGPYFGAFSFEVLSCWIVGAASGLIVTAKYYDETGRSFPISLAIVVTIALVAVVGDRPLMRMLSDSRELEVITVKWRPGSESLSGPSILGTQLTNADVERLKSIGLTGEIEFASSGMFGEGKHAKAIIVITQPLKEPTALPQPKGSDVIYLQTPYGWQIYPPNAQMLERNIQLFPDQQQPERATRYSVENRDGSRQGGTLVTW